MTRKQQIRVPIPLAIENGIPESLSPMLNPCPKFASHPHFHNESPNEVLRVLGRSDWILWSLTSDCEYFLLSLTSVTEQTSLGCSCNSSKVRSKGESNKQCKNAVIIALSWCSFGEVEVFSFPAISAVLQQNQSFLSSSLFLRTGFCTNSIVSL